MYPLTAFVLNAGYPAPSLVPADKIRAAVNHLIHEEQDLPLHYLGSPHIRFLLEIVQTRLSVRGIRVTDEELLITAGGCQAIDLIARILLDQNAVVAVEAPSYMEALEIFKNYTNQIVSIPIDEYGLHTDSLRALLQERRQRGLGIPRFLYTIPSFHNPTGVTLTEERRHQLLFLANEFDFFIVEDDAYGELSFSSTPIPIKALDTNERVLYIGSYSKVIAPGLRIGWVAGPKQLISAISWFKKDLDHPFAQATVATYLQSINFEERLKSLQDSYRARRDIMIHAMTQWMPESVAWHSPEGGYFIWLYVPKVDTSQMVEQALKAGVAYVPGRYFFINQKQGLEFLRLSFSYVDPKQIEEGVKRLATIIASQHP